MIKRKYGYPKLIKGTKCETCLGCNRLELIDFMGIYPCENYIGGMTNERDSGRDTENDETVF